MAKEKYMRIPGARRLLLAAVVTLPALSAAHAAAPEAHTLLIRPATVLDSGEFAVSLHLARQYGRQPQGINPNRAQGRANYDNTRLGPLAARYGLGHGLELGAAIAHNNNSGSRAGDPDESGLEGVTLFGRYRLMPTVAIEAGLHFAGSDDVAPYPRDGLDLYVNVSASQRIRERGFLYGQLGATGTDEDGTGGVYENWGVGAGYQLTPRQTLNIELVGDTAPERYARGAHTEVLLGTTFAATHAFTVKPYVGAGVYDPSPDWSLGLTLEYIRR
ncbi:MAG: porin family protein [Ectothiorhodospiraceae bacterium]|nr:porin family protein [Ectothiorhodospiraceae bacterium]